MPPRIVMLTLALLAAACAGDRARVDEARSLLLDDSGFSTALESGQTFLRVSELLVQAAEQCVREEDRARCDTRFSAAGYTRNVSVRVLSCTRPAIFDARHAVLEYLDHLDDRDFSPAPLPDCP